MLVTSVGLHSRRQSVSTRQLSRSQTRTLNLNIKPAVFCATYFRRSSLVLSKAGIWRKMRRRTWVETLHTGHDPEFSLVLLRGSWFLRKGNGEVGFWRLMAYDLREDEAGSINTVLGTLGSQGGTSVSVVV
ncbi:hypothetical protein AA313_de0206767 [Arthrobotrys entomopaga]|nr:hypothetical protein AA313_de0206767 [Arthrobotrys entomopaga]